MESKRFVVYNSSDRRVRNKLLTTLERGLQDEKNEPSFKQIRALLVEI